MPLPHNVFRAFGAMRSRPTRADTDLPRVVVATYLLAPGFFADLAAA